MAEDRIALISDVHGNLTALEAVLADIGERGITRVFNLGDSAGKGPRGDATTSRCREVCEVNIRGNWDDFWVTIADADAEDLVWWRDELTGENRRWLGQLPFSVDLTFSGRRIRLLHASPQGVTVRVWGPRDPEQFDGMFENTELTGDGPEPEIVGYGDVHYTYHATIGRRTLFNVGSVGNPMDEPSASYVILEGTMGAPERGPFSITFARVPYDIEAEVAVVEALEMPTRDPWITELRTCLYRGLGRR